MIEPDESGITKTRVQIRPFVRQDVSVEIDSHAQEQKTPNAERRAMPLSGELNAGFIIGALAGA
jgi:hypothetical protein